MIDVKETLSKSEERMEMAAMFLEDELNRIRAGRANVAILDGVRVESYGSKVPLNQAILRKLLWTATWVLLPRTTAR